VPKGQAAKLTSQAVEIQGHDGGELFL